jgi:hypothetical protein
MDKFIEELQKLELSPGDILVAKMRPFKFNAVNQKRMKESLRTLLDSMGKDNAVIVVSADDVSFSVERGDEG